MTDYRHLPPVEPLETWPRLSQTILKAADACPRSGYLAAKHRGGPSSHAMDRGSAFHAVAERMTTDLLVAGERSYFGDGEQADASMVHALVAEVLDERTDLHVPTAERDDVRMLAWHLANTLVVDPNTIIGVERKFVLDVAGREVSGIIDLALLGEDRVAEVRDYKTAAHVPDEESYRRSFQARFYGMLLCFGFPVRKVAVPPEHDGATGYFVEEREPSVGEHIGWVRASEVYPRYVLESGKLRAREHIFSRTDLSDFRADLERLVQSVDERRESGLFPAVPGSHCSICPAPHECPLPAVLRDHAGAINTPEQAAEAAMWADFTGDKLAAVNKEVKNYAAGNGGRVRYGRDLVREFVTVEGRAVRKKGRGSDWDGLVAAIEDAALMGAPFDVDEWIKRTASSNFKKRKLTADELDDEQGETDERVDDRTDDERWGADAPW